jgi:hypothetical protein
MLRRFSRKKNDRKAMLTNSTSTTRTSGTCSGNGCGC